MAMKFTLLSLVAMIATLLPDVQGQCNACFENTKIACIDENHFVPCFSGKEIDTTYKQKCPANTVCTALAHKPCESPDFEPPACADERPICSDCSQIANQGYVCMDDTSYGICFGNVAMSGVSFTCTGNTKCIQKWADAGTPCVDCSEMGEKYLCRPKVE